jgi:hypothetical protein
MFFAMVWWFVSARKWFKGPKVNIDHMMFADNQVVEGKEAAGASEQDSPAPTYTKTAEN